MIARNRCSKCAHEWRDSPMGFAAHYSCPKCGSAYWVWTNYEKAPATSKKDLETPGSKRASEIE